MTYVNKKARIFLDRGDIKPERRRSEARLKTYPSAIDIRAWCGIVEDRRQHILELVNKTRESCLGKLIPLEAIIDALLAGRVADCAKLRKCLTQLWKCIEDLNLSDEDRNKVAIMREKMDPICVGMDDGDGDRKNVSVRMLLASLSSQECVAKARHEREQEEINALLNPDNQGGGSYKVKTRGPAKIITRVKGMRPGVKVVPGAPSGSITTRTQGPARVVTRAENVFSNLKQKDNTQIATPQRQSPREQSFNQDFTFEQSRDETLDQSSNFEQPLGQSSLRESLDKTSLETPSRQSPKTRSPDQTPRVKQSPRKRSLEIPQEHLGRSQQRHSVHDQTPLSQSVNRQSPDQTVSRQSPIRGSPEKSSQNQHFEQSVRTQSAEQSPTRQSQEKSPQGQHFEQSVRSQPSKQSPTRQSLDKSPRGQHFEQSVRSQSSEQSPDKSPRGQHFEQSVRGQSSEQSPTRQSPEKSARGQHFEQSVRSQPSQQPHTTQQSPQKFPFVQLMPLQPQERKMSYPSQISESQLEDSVFIRSSETSREFTPLWHSTMTEQTGVAPKMNIDGSSPRIPENLIIQLEARETLCNELQGTLENVKYERDDFRKKFESTLEELETLKKLNAASPVIPTSCKEEIEALELEIKVMRSGNLSPEQEADVIKKEVDVLKKYCMKLKSVEDENEKLILERDTLKSQVILSEDTANEKPKSVKDNLNRQVAGILGDTEEKHKMEVDSTKDVVESFDNLDWSNLQSPYIEELKSKLKTLEDITRERDTLANRVQRLEKELLQYRDLPEDIDVYRNRSKMLDSALEERDKMSKKVEQLKEMEDELNQLKKKSSRVDELEEELKLFSKNDKNIGGELKKAKSRCTCLEKELENVKMERDSMRTRIEYMKKETDMLRSKSKEAEVFKVERDKLQLRVTELSHIQVQYENLLLKCKCLQNAAAEKDMYKQKYEEILKMECQGDLLRSQVEAAKQIERERNALVKQVGDLESCICEQEEEMKKLVTQIDNLCRNKDDNQCRMREALTSMRAEIEKKDCLIAESEEKLAAVQTQLKSSIQGVSCETTCYKTRIEDLERELNKAHLQNEALKKQLNRNDGSLRGIEKLTKSECESVATMKRELAAAKEENKKLRDIANKMVTLTGDEHVQSMLKQSQCAVKRVVEELGKQYKEWDSMKRNQKKGIFAQVNKRCPCKYKHADTRHASDSENEKLTEELEDIQREKDKLEQIVKQIQNDKFSDGPQNEVISLREHNAKLQELLQVEMEKRKELERKLKITVE